MQSTGLRRLVSDRMLSYRHAFHAGNHADILKHTVLVALLRHLKEKPKPFTVFDTHAGAGRYLLDDERLIKTGEAESGICRLLAALPDSGRSNAADIYRAVCTTYKDSGLYPGSPELCRCLMRPSDTLILSELHTTEIQVLKKNMRLPVLYREGAQKETVIPRIHHRNGYEMLQALTPPAVRRGLALIDPSYEETSDYRDTADTIAAVRKKWPAGITALWYPLLDHRKNETASMKRIVAAAAHSGAERTGVLDVCLLVHPSGSHRETSLEESSDAVVPRLYGSGMLIVNPPWKLEEELRTLIPVIAEILAPDSTGSWSVSLI